jgi:ribonuclease HI
MPITKLFTDGSTLNNQGAKKGCSYGGYGGYILFSNGNEQVYSEPLEGDKITNQVAELMALKHGLEVVLPLVPKDLIYVYTDSMYVINIYTSWIKKWIADNWKKPDGKPVENHELIKEIYELITESNAKIFYKHVKAHQVAPDDVNSAEYKIWYGNAKADELAVYSATISKENNKDKQIKTTKKTKKNII